MVWEFGWGGRERSRGDIATGCGAGCGGQAQSNFHAPKNHTGSSGRSNWISYRDGDKLSRDNWRDPG